MPELGIRRLKGAVAWRDGVMVTNGLWVMIGYVSTSRGTDMEEDGRGDGLIGL